MEKMYNMTKEGVQLAGTLRNLLLEMGRRGFVTSYSPQRRPHLYLTTDGEVCFNSSKKQYYMGDTVFRIAVPKRYLKETENGKYTFQIRPFEETDQIDDMIEEQIKAFLEDMK